MTERTDRQCRLSVHAFHQVGVAAIVERRGHRTLICVDVWADRYDLLRSLHEYLDVEELGIVREAFGWPEAMVPIGWLDEVGPIAVPESLWLSRRALRGDDDR
jgi:hypothetical protein